MIDTAAKRRSAAGVHFWPLSPGVTPDAAKPAAWRQQAGWGYSGIDAGEEEPSFPGGAFQLADPGRTFRLQAPGRGWQLADPGRTFQKGA